MYLKKPHFLKKKMEGGGGEELDYSHFERLQTLIRQ